MIKKKKNSHIIILTVSWTKVSKKKVERKVIGHHQIEIIQREIWQVKKKWGKNGYSSTIGNFDKTTLLKWKKKKILLQNV